MLFFFLISSNDILKQSGRIKTTSYPTHLFAKRVRVRFEERGYWKNKNALICLKHSFSFLYSKSFSVMSDGQNDIACLDILIKCIKLMDLQGYMASKCFLLSKKNLFFEGKSYQA